MVISLHYSAVMYSQQVPQQDLMTGYRIARDLTSC